MPDPGGRRAGRPRRPPAREPALKGPHPGLVDLVGRLIGAHGGDGRVPVIAVVGAQGSGKTTLARAAAARFGAAQISIDDVYLTRAEREALARDVHPLLLTRGPPGTHDLDLLQGLIDRLAGAADDDETRLPDFDKRGDDRRPESDWRSFRGRPSAVLVDAWCLGATAQPEAELAAPVNELEAARDSHATWRRWVNARVAGDYAAFAGRCDAILFLAAPGFEVVLDWRCEQEADLLGLSASQLPASERERLALFIQHYERITRHMLAGGVRADVTVRLDGRRRILGELP